MAASTDGSSETLTAATATESSDDEEDCPDIVINIRNVVCAFNVGCALNLRDIAERGSNVEFRPSSGMVIMKQRRPNTTATIFASGKIICTGTTSEETAKVAARRIARSIQKLGFSAQLRNFRVVNVVATSNMPWGIKIINFTEKYRNVASYEPELHPGVVYTLYNPKASLKIFATGCITVTAANVAHPQMAIEHIFPLVWEFRSEHTQQGEIEMQEQVVPTFEPECVRRSSRRCMSRYSSSRIECGRAAGKADNDPAEDMMYVSDDDGDADDEDEYMIESE